MSKTEYVESQVAELSRQRHNLTHAQSVAMGTAFCGLILNIFWFLVVCFESPDIASEDDTIKFVGSMLPYFIPSAIVLTIWYVLNRFLVQRLRKLSTAILTFKSSRTSLPVRFDRSA